MFIFFIIAASFIISNSFCSAQNRKIDLLLTLIKTDKVNTNKVNHLCQLMGEYELTGNFEKGLIYGEEALKPPLIGIYKFRQKSQGFVIPFNKKHIN